MFARYWIFELIRKLVLLLQISLVSAALLVGFSAWKLDSALKQPLKLPQERLLDVPAGATPTGTFNRLEADGVLDDAFGCACTGASTSKASRCTAVSTA